MPLFHNKYQIPPGISEAISSVCYLIRFECAPPNIRQNGMELFQLVLRTVTYKIKSHIDFKVSPRAHTHIFTWLLPHDLCEWGDWTFDDNWKGLRRHLFYRKFIVFGIQRIVHKNITTKWPFLLYQEKKKILTQHSFATINFILDMALIFTLFFLLYRSFGCKMQLTDYRVNVRNIRTIGTEARKKWICSSSIWNEATTDE